MGDVIINNGGVGEKESFAASGQVVLACGRVWKNGRKERWPWDLGADGRC